jgi:Uma2 family endonuclease
MTVPLLEQETEKLITVPGVSWQQFKTIEVQLAENHAVKLAYLAGVLEIMSPIGDKHEYVKKTLSYLLEAYMRYKGIRFYGRGGFTLEAAGYASGTPDESYCIGTNKEVPDIVIEIIVSSGSINRTELYKPKRVPEVWFWRNNKIQIFSLNAVLEYEEVNRSRFFTDLDQELLLQFLSISDQYDAVSQFIEFISDK